MKRYLYGNYETVREFFRERLPQFHILPLEGTYLVWIDCSVLGISSEEAAGKLMEEGRIMVNSGEMYGETEGMLHPAQHRLPQGIAAPGAGRNFQNLRRC